MNYFSIQSNVLWTLGITEGICHSETFLTLTGRGNVKETYSDQIGTQKNMWTMDFGLWTMHFGLQSLDCGLWTTDYGTTTPVQSILNL